MGLITGDLKYYFGHDHELRPIVGDTRGTLLQRTKLLLFGKPVPLTPTSRDNPQDAVLLLHRLPAELRALIWHNYFFASANNVVHIAKYGTQEAECIAESWLDFRPIAHYECLRWKQKRKRLDLLLTCKRIYFECAPLLYRTSIFDFSSNLYTISNFRKVTSEVQFTCITHVNITLAATSQALVWPAHMSSKVNENGYTHQWALVWGILASMEDLRWLRFELRLYYDGYEEDWVRSLDFALQPVKMVTKPPHFELILPFDIGDWAQHLPCQVVRSQHEGIYKFH